MDNSRRNCLCGLGGLAVGGAVAALQLAIAVLLLALSLVLVHEGWQALRRKGRPAAEKA